MELLSTGNQSKKPINNMFGCKKYIIHLYYFTITNHVAELPHARGE